MSVRTICAQLFGVVALVAALVVLPQAANAHAGHTHAIHVQAIHVQAAHVQTGAVDATAAVHGTSERHAAQSLTAAAKSMPGPAGDVPCPSGRGCCGNSCAACFSLVAPMPPLVLPPSQSVTISLSARPGRSGIGGPSLRRPPRSFS